MADLLTELKRRNVFRVGVVYVVTAWLLAQAGDLAAENFGAPDWVMQMFMVMLALGVPIALIFAWAFEITPEGIKKEKDVDRTQSITPTTGRKLDRFIIVSMGIALVYFAVTHQWGTEDPKPTTVTESGVGKSIAVLPFANLSDSAENEYFSDGIAEELLNLLAKIPELKVAARTSSFSFKGKDVDIPTIAQKLGVETVLEGSVRRSGNKVRITAQLINASDGFHLWSDTYTRELDDIFVVQDEIASHIADALRVTLDIRDQGAVTARPTENLEAYEAVLRGRHLFLQRGKGPLNAAIKEFEKAIELDPDYVDAWSGLAMAYGVLYFYTSEITQEDSVGRSVELATKTIELDPYNGMAYSLLAFGFENTGDMVKAHEYHNRAIELSPNDPTILSWYSEFFGDMGYTEEAAEWSARAYALDPLSPVVVMDFSYAQLELGNPEVALPYSKFVWDGGLREGFVWNGVFRALIQMERFDEALAWADELPLRAGEPAASLEPQRAAARAVVEALMEPTGENRARARRALQASGDAGISSNAPRYLALLGEADAAFVELERASRRDSTSYAVLFEPAWDELRGDPRTLAILEMRGAIDLWHKIGPPDHCRAVGDTFECD
ncbi:MAG: tetratricopeptide repeat protein [Gammaproteobacteria bacterium]|nr:MAG: tetratricopeptide repeat protein [Gammaproteobacteria bacterium]